MRKKRRLVLRTKLRLQLKPVLIYCSGCAALLIMVSVLYFNVGTAYIAKASVGTEQIDSGSFIVNMGIVPQTTSNGLRPYGMVYDIINNYDTPVKWCFNESKVKDGTDFTYNGVAYKGGPFIVPASLITTTIKSRITYWLTQGVQGVYTTSAFNAPVYSNLTSVPMVMIDTTSGKEDIIKKYFVNAMLPTTAYYTGATSNLTGCFDVWVNPHGDPTWTSHQWLYDFATTNNAFIFSQCHATSVMEGVRNPVTPFQQLNFLTTNGLKCFSSNKCGPAITETHGGSPIGPFAQNYPGDPIMQFMGDIAPALSGGSEDWYIPQSTGAWRPTTKRCVTSADAAPPREGVLLAYGPAFGLANAGWVMYEGGHDLDGTSVANIAAQRCFFNFLFFASARKSIDLSATAGGGSTIELPENGTTKTIAVAAAGGSPPYQYKWSSSNNRINFGDDTKATTTVKVSNSGSGSASTKVSGIITVKISDACGKQNFLARPFVTNPNALPVVLSSFGASVKNDQAVQLYWSTASEKDNDFFTLDRSVDGEQFTEIKRVRGAGNSNNLLKYSYVDEQPINGVSYYRLRQTDYNGITEIFKTVAVKINAHSLSEIKVYPNPIGSAYIAEFVSSTEQEMEIQLINIQGLVIDSEKVMAVKGLNNRRINIGKNIPSGTYIIRIIDETEKHTSVRVNIED